MVHQEARGRAKCESVLRTQGIEDYKNIRYGAFTFGGQGHKPSSRG